MGQKQASRAGKSNYIPQYPWDVLVPGLDTCVWYDTPHTGHYLTTKPSWFKQLTTLIIGPLRPSMRSTVWKSNIWWRHQMEIFSALLAFCAVNSQVTGEFPAQRPVTRSFEVFFYLRLTDSWANNGDAGDLRRHRAHYDVIVIKWTHWPLGDVAVISTE